MAVNLSRNTKVYYTNVVGANTGYNNLNTFEFQVLNGYQFSQNTEQQTIQISEAGATPNRGQRSFNSKLNPVEWSFSTYVRPKKTTTGVGNLTVNGNITKASSADSFATLTTSATHTLSTGDYITISGGTGSSTAYNTPTNVAVPVVSVSATVITFACSTVAPTPSAGTIVINKVVRTTCPEKWLWNALFNKNEFLNYAQTPVWLEAAANTSLTVANSDAHQLAPFALIFKVDNVYYKINSCAVNQAEVQFGLDQIAQINWSGFGTTITQFPTTDAAATQLTSITAADTTAQFITNKLTTVQLYQDLAPSATTSYTVAITGGSLTINNNLQYLTPEILGTVNSPIGYFTGTRAISGSLTAYLKTGAVGSPWDTAGLFNNIIAGSANNSENKFNGTIELGGGSNTTRVDFVLPAIMIQVPTIEIQDVVSTTINFTAQKYNGQNYDLDVTPNEMVVKYYAT